jgi:F-type H+-transporting ATPase subunit a
MELLKWKVYAFYMVLTSLILILVGVLAVSKSAKVPGRLQGFFEWSIEALRGTFMGALGPGGERHLPLIYTLFFYILFCNLIELVPGFRAATANPSNTIAMGVIVFFYTQYIGIKNKGFWNYLKHFFGPLLVLAPLFFVIEILGELVKPFSLGMRLFGNIYAEDVMNDLAAKAVYLPALHCYLPLQIIVYPLQIFTGVIQAFIFALLTCAYIGIMSEHHDSNGDGHDPHPHKETPEEHAALTIGSIGARAINP